LREVVARDMRDAAVPGLSDDRRFATAYGAALQLCKVVIACAGYRVKAATGHHRATIEAMVLALGPQAQDMALYLDVCRRKRNIVDYDRAYVATQTEADELLEKVRAFGEQVESWIAANHPQWIATGANAP
jgi:hypothetical protein